LVDILHIGRHDTAGYFYYVMELADDASTMAAPGSSVGAPDATRGDDGAEPTSPKPERPHAAKRYVQRTLDWDLQQ
jgi:hypothetical protein